MSKYLLFFHPSCDPVEKPLFGGCLGMSKSLLRLPDEFLARLSKRRGVDTESPAKLWSGYQRDCANVVREMSRDYPGFRLEVVRVGFGHRFDYFYQTFKADGNTVMINVPTWKTPVDKTPPIR